MKILCTTTDNQNRYEVTNQGHSEVFFHTKCCYCRPVIHTCRTETIETMGYTENGIFSCSKLL